ncbi:hypothetical protein BLA18109_02262 [Burkholderia lata]|uniref:Uncharacterized protein n=1 Tax=Burkholderia lata (strain ATCC 17760 / DSM 23089 / LMG 22485 / NCIMB 9086 / R18194 / 383) TaxID=482957 RepID=A0A6P2UF88_BURL3|nr:hypothetical protein BLA18109_02262 [Burkholderia lata]
MKVVRRRVRRGALTRRLFASGLQQAWQIFDGVGGRLQRSDRRHRLRNHTAFGRGYLDRGRREAVWRSGGLAVWRSGGLAVWRSGRIDGVDGVARVRCGRRRPSASPPDARCGRRRPSASPPDTRSRVRTGPGISAHARTLVPDSFGILAHRFEKGDASASRVPRVPRIRALQHPASASASRGRSGSIATSGSLRLAGLRTRRPPLARID